MYPSYLKGGLEDASYLDSTRGCVRIGNIYSDHRYLVSSIHHPTQSLHAKTDTNYLPSANIENIID